LQNFAPALLAELQRASQWPLKREQKPLEKIRRRRAFYESDERIIKTIANWHDRSRTLFVGDTPRQYIIDPLAARIAEGYADFLFGDEVEVDVNGPDGVDVSELSASDITQDDQWLEQIVEENQLDSELWAAEARCVSEGEVWWHLFVDRDASDVPQLEWISRSSVVPLYRGKRLVAAALMQTIAVEGEGNAERHYRLAEIHSDGQVINALFMGGRDKLGTQVPLTAQDLTATYTEEWNHGLPMLAGRVRNGFASSGNLGFSEFDRIEGLLLELNEARTIGAENARLTAKKRLFANASMMSTDETGLPSFPTGDDVIVTDPGGGVLGGGSDKPPVTAVEYSFDAAPLIAHTQEVERTILSRVGLVPQFIGTDVTGGSDSGTAIRLRFMPTVNAAKGKAREWDSQLPKILQLCMLVDQLPEEQGGFGRPYAYAGFAPSVHRGSVLPEDEGEEIRNLALSVSSEIMSRETAIRSLHEDWTDEQVTDEAARIASDAGQMFAPVPTLTDRPIAPMEQPETQA
jgi:hypothetical protein